MSSAVAGRTLVFSLLALLLLSESTSSFAQEADLRLKKRIAELEAENRSLRKIIGQMQGVLKAVPDSTDLQPDSASSLRILIANDDWGGSGIVDIRKVCESAGGTITANLADDGFAPIFVRRGKSGPITLYRRGESHEYIVQLDTSDRAWAQLAYQFAHEFCHILCNYRSAKNPQKWFEETVCEVASLYALRRMAVEWKTNPPWSNWKGYSAALSDYADNRIKTYAEQEDSIGKFYRTHQAELEATGTNRELNSCIAVKLLPMFEANPDLWQSLRYLNLGPAEENGSLNAYLTGWHNRVPRKQREQIRKLAAEFEIEIETESVRQPG